MNRSCQKTGYLAGSCLLKKYAFLFFFFSTGRYFLYRKRSSTAIPPVGIYVEQWDQNAQKVANLEEALEKRICISSCIYAPMNIHSEEWLHFDFDQPWYPSHQWLSGATLCKYLYHTRVNRYNPGKNLFLV